MTKPITEDFEGIAAACAEIQTQEASDWLEVHIAKALELALCNSGIPIPYDEDGWERLIAGINVAFETLSFEIVVSEKD